MKKTARIFAIALAIAFTTTFVSCGSKSVVDEYESIVNEMVEVMPKAKEGDTDAAKKMLDLKDKAEKFAKDNEEELKNLSEEDQKRMQEIALKAAQEMMK